MTVSVVLVEVACLGVMMPGDVQMRKKRDVRRVMG